MSKKSIARLLLVVGVVATMIVVGRLSGAVEWLSRDNIQQVASDLGVFGVLFFLAAFCVGQLIYDPGIIFIGAAILAYGPIAGGVLSYVGCVLAVTVAFVVVRKVGGQPLTEVQRPRVRKLLALIDSRPILAVMFLRWGLFIMPPVNYALALSSIRFRHFFIGTLLGLVHPVAGAVLILHFAMGPGT